MENWGDALNSDKLFGAGWRERGEAWIRNHHRKVEAHKQGLEPPPPSRSRSLRTLRGPELILSSPPEPKFCVHGFLSCPSLNLLVGDPGHKKSLLAIDLALCVAMGAPWLGLPVTQKPIVLVEEESGLLRLWRRLHSAFTAHSATIETPFHFISMGNYDFRDINEASDLIEHARSVEAGLIVIDALANVMVGGDENSVLSVQPILHNLRAVAIDCGAAVLIIHHTNKSGFFRGSTSLSAGVDQLLSVYSPPGQTLLRLTTLKSRDLEPITLHAHANFETDRFWLEPTEDRFPDPNPSSALSASAFHILDFLSQYPGATTPEMMTGIGNQNPASVRKNLYDLTIAGYITRIDGNTRGKIAHYQLSPSGQKVLSSHANL